MARARLPLNGSRRALSRLSFSFDADVRRHAPRRIDVTTNTDTTEKSLCYLLDITRDSLATRKNVVNIKDRKNYPLGPDRFVRVDSPGLTPSYPVAYRGLVTEVATDKKGPYLVIREYFGGFTGHTRYARPEHCEVRTRPPALLEQQKLDAMRDVAAR
jgi:hypothetical protein